METIHLQLFKEKRQVLAAFSSSYWSGTVRFGLPLVQLNLVTIETMLAAPQICVRETQADRDAVCVCVWERSRGFVLTGSQLACGAASCPNEVILRAPPSSQNLFKKAASTDGLTIMISKHDGINAIAVITSHIPTETKITTKGFALWLSGQYVRVAKVQKAETKTDFFENMLNLRDKL